MSVLCMTPGKNVLMEKVCPVPLGFLLTHVHENLMTHTWITIIYLFIYFRFVKEKQYEE